MQGSPVPVLRGAGEPRSPSREAQGSPGQLPQDRDPEDSGGQSAEVEKAEPRVRDPGWGWATSRPKDLVPGGCRVNRQISHANKRIGGGLERVI